MIAQRGEAGAKVRTLTTEKLWICGIEKSEEIKASWRKQAGCGVKVVSKHMAASNAAQADDRAPSQRVAV